MSPTSHVWNELNDAVLTAFTDTTARSITDIHRTQPGVPDTYIRAALHQLTENGYLTPTRGAVHTTYRITEAGTRHLANTMEVA